MMVQVKKWGNSASVRIPASKASCALRRDQRVEMRNEEGRIIEPIGTSVYELDALLSKMMPETFSEDLDFGTPVGKEIC